MKDLVKNLVTLQDLDSRILEKRQFIDKVPMRIFEVDEPLKLAKLELDKMKQKNEVLAGKKRDRERVLGEITEFRDKQPTDIGFHRGRAKMRFWIIDPGTGKTRLALWMAKQLSLPAVVARHPVYELYP